MNLILTISVYPALIALAITAVLGFVVIPYLRKLKFGQTIREDGPTWHNSKTGTPTMGGIMIAAGFLISLILSFTYVLLTTRPFLVENRTEITLVIAGVGLTIGMGLIGFIDDYIKVVKKRNLGLTAKQKTTLQLLVAAAYLSSLALSGINTTWLPFIGDVNITSGFGIIFWPIALMFIYGFTNAVNLTDGVDGLASTVTLVVCCAFMLISVFLNKLGVNMFASAAAGACLGFLTWNAHPAKVFMGDTGSLLLGGIVVSLAFSIGRPILLIAAGIMYIVEAFSVILQVAYYKKTKKRLFKMSPIHHHFEMSGYSEEKIVLLFSIITAVGCFIAALPTII